MHSHSRRDFFARLAGGWLGASILDRAAARAALARAQAPAAPAGLFELEKVADGVYAATARHATIIECNAAVFENARDLVIVDTHTLPSTAAALTAQLRRLTPKPVRYVVNTHFHGDHVLGNPAYRKLAPGADFISSTATRRLIEEVNPKFLQEMVESAPKQVEALERSRDKAKTPEERAEIERGIADLRAFREEMHGYAFELPNITFDQNLVLHDPAGELRLAFRGRGHTAGDIVVFSPATKVIASGDLLHGFLPYFGDGYPREWPRTLAAIGEFGFETIIGGHGAPQRTRERLPQMSAYIEELTSAVARGKERGRTAEQLQKEITPAVMKSLGGGYGEYVAGQLARYNGAEGTPAEILAERLKEQVATVWRVLEKT